VIEIKGRLIAAPATPRDEHGQIILEDLEKYAAAIGGGTDGVCVWAHTAHGLHLSDTERKLVLDTFRASTTGPVIAAVGPLPEAIGDFDTELASAQHQAEAAATGGADALMVYPAASLQPEETRAERTVRMHVEIATAVGLPAIGFLLYPEAGGVSYDPGLLTELAARPEVIGVKLATLYDAMACQDAIAAIHQGGALAITGEDRMFGPSLMWGADAALVGIAAGATEISRNLMRTWFSNDPEFLDASARLDRLANATFKAPMQGYVQRMLWIAEREGILPARSAYDPYGVSLPESERAEVHAAYDAL
jgi:4-hydroxy-tetrahydrodipicolinate synthase